MLRPTAASKAAPAALRVLRTAAAGAHPIATTMTTTTTTSATAATIGKRLFSSSIPTAAATMTERRVATWMGVQRPGTQMQTQQPQRMGAQQGQRRWKSEEQLKSRNRSGPFSWRAGILFAITGGFLLWFFDHEKERMKQKRMAEANKGYGKPRVGGAFELMDTDGNVFTDKDLRGRYSLIYFGFSHCPDICPEELDKMATMYEMVRKSMPSNPNPKLDPSLSPLQPLFITCDPARDDPKTLAAYLREFHPDFVGLTGTYEQVKAACKAYRVYFSTPEKVKPGEDYLVDHSIYFYIMDPEGDFVEVLGRQHSPEEGAKVILGHIRDWDWKSKSK